MVSRDLRAGARVVATSLAALLLAALGPGRALAQPPPASVPKSEQPVDPYAQPAPEPAPRQEPPAAAEPPAAGEQPAAGEPEPGSEPGPKSSLGADDDVDDQVAQALYRRGVALYRRGATADARTMFIESLERSPKGTVSGEALRMLRAANRRLGIANADAGRPSAQGEGVIDPYAGGAQPPATEAPLDPYGGATPTPSPPSRPAEVDTGAPPEEPEAEQGSVMGRRAVIAWSGAVGLVAGMAVAGPQNDSGDVSDGAIIGGLVGAAGGVGLSYWLTRRVPLSLGQSAAIASAATWGGTWGGLLGDAATGTDSAPNDVWKYVAAGGLVGLGGGAAYAVMAKPSEEDVALTNSLAIFGAGAGVSIAAGMEVPESEAFALNALFGSTAGIAAGLLLAPRVEISLRRTLLLDAGAAAGAAASWGILYPLIADGTTRNDEQIAGWVATATMTGGVVVTWLLTRGMDERVSGPLAARASRRRALPPPPALARRDADGSWQLGVPFLRPLVSRDLAPPAHATALGVDLLSGRF
jgi:hypothetical protein